MSASRTATVTSPTISRGNSYSRSYVSRIEPPSEFSIAMTPASTPPDVTSSNTARHDGTATADGAAKYPSTASSENAPGSPWYATRGETGSDDGAGDGSDEGA